MHCPAMPWMPAVADLTEVSNMGVALLSCVIPNEIIKARGISSCSLLRLWRPPRLEEVSAAANASAVCFGTTQRQLDYLTIRAEFLR